MLVVLGRGGYWGSTRWGEAFRRATWLLVGFLTVGSMVNFASPSMWERLGWGPFRAGPGGYVLRPGPKGPLGSNGLTEPSARPEGRHPRGPRRSRTQFVVLGLLTYGPASAYALRQRIEASVGYFWQESFGQLFPTLARLESEGLVRGTPVSSGKRRRRDYRITPAGRTALAAWLREPPLPQPERNEMLLKVFFASEGGVGQLGGFIAEAEAEARAQLGILRGIETDLRQRFAADPRMAFRLLTVRYGILGLEAYLRWVKEAYHVVHGQPESERLDPG